MLKTELTKISKNIGQNFKTVAETASKFASQGLNSKEVLKRTNDALILNRLSNLTINESVDSINKIINSFK